ncbi:MAG: DUF4139 domain-containing protein [Planctomycetaceae bacterium]
MRPRSMYLALPFLCLAAVFALPAHAVAQEDRPMKNGDAPGVPLRKLVMFTSGVGYFEHAGEVKDDASVELRFNVEDINDLLKSMVLEDAGGGRISTVTYPSRDPVTRALRSFEIDLTENPTLAELLRQLRGKAVEVQAPQAIRGTVVGVERRERKVGDDVVEYDVVNLLTDAGLKSLPLENVTSIKLLDERLNDEFKKALAVLATSNDKDQKTVTLNFLGAGERRVRVGYVQETPVWKTSYRLVLADDDQAHLQGWAIVENTTEMDWSDVDLTLVSGRPISFRMDLYQPLYVNRPLVELELYSSLVPKVYDQDLGAADMEFAGRGDRGREMQRRAGLRDEKLAEAREPAAAAPPGRPASRNAASEMERKMDMIASVQSAASAAELGELFQYRIDTPVTLERQKSAMLPIVGAEVKAEKLSIYNQQTHAKHPLNGLRFTNTTELNLMQGPITVFDDGAYAGDSRIEDIAPKSTRLLSYAIDLDTEVAVETKSKPEQLLSVKIVKGVLYASRKYHRENLYTVKNSGSREKTVLLEQPFDPNWKLIAPAEPAEKTRDLYRFGVQAKPGEPEKLTVAEELTQQQTVALTNIPDPTIAIYLSARVVGAEVKDALREVQRRKLELSQLAMQKQQLEQQVATIQQDHARIGQLLTPIDRTTELYNRYLKKLGEQEDELEKLRARIVEIQEEERRKRQALDEYLAGLTIEQATP